MKKMGSEEHVAEVTAAVLEKYAGFRVTERLCDRIATDVTALLMLDFPDEPEPIVKVARADDDPSRVEIKVRKA